MPLTEAIEAIRPPGCKISIQDLCRTLPKRALDALGQSQRRLRKRREKLEKDFFCSLHQHLRKFAKHQANLYRKVFAEDARLRRRMLGDRKRFERRFFKADARTVRRREEVLRKFLTRELKKV